jgi:hypothetical protein
LVPPLRRYGGKLRLPADRPAALRCLRVAITIVRSCLSLPTVSSASKWGLGSWFRPGALPYLRWSRQDLPGSWGTLVHARRALRPRWGLRARLLRRVGAAAARKTTAAPASCFISRLNHTAHTLPVYASQPGLPPSHATLGSGWSPAFAGRARPAGFLCKVSVMSSHVVLLTQALPGALSAETCVPSSSEPRSWPHAAPRSRSTWMMTCPRSVR